MPNLGNRTVGQDPSAANVRDPQQKGDEIQRSRGQDEHGKKADQVELPGANAHDQKGAESSEDNAED